MVFLQLEEMENLTFLGSILLGYKQTFPGPEQVALKASMAPLHCESLVCFFVRELVCYLHCPVRKGRVELDGTFA